MKKTVIFIFVMIFIQTLYSCKKDDSRTCTQCSSPQTPSFELCEESNGNASINGEDTGTSYDVYLENLQQDGVTCGN